MSGAHPRLSLDRCLVTGGCKATFQLESIFWTLCKAKQHAYRKSHFDKIPVFCDLCDKTTLPKEVTISKLTVVNPNEKKAEKMAEKVTGQCEMCEKENKELFSHTEKMVCTTCKAARSYIINNPEAALDAIRHRYTLHGFLNDEEKKMVAADLMTVVGGLQDEVERLSAQVKDAEQPLRSLAYPEPCHETNGAEIENKCNKVAWDIAMDAVRGTVKGITPIHLNAIRNIHKVAEHE